MKIKKGMVSCLCISHNSLDLLERSISCFLSQTYQKKEMIIVYYRNKYITETFKLKHFNQSILFHEINSTQNVTLGEQRNKSIEISSGEYVCIWDDDDWYNNIRIEIQVAAIKRSFKPACLLTNLLLFDQESQTVYHTHTRMWEGSLLCKRKLLKKHSFENVNINEDTPLLNTLLNNECVIPLIGPTIYIYIHHGKNTWHTDHFKKIMNISQRLSENFGFLVNDIVSGKLSNKMGSKKLLSSTYLKEINYLNVLRDSRLIFHLTKNQTSSLSQQNIKN